MLSCLGLGGFPFSLDLSHSESKRIRRVKDSREGRTSIDEMDSVEGSISSMNMLVKECIKSR